MKPLRCRNHWWDFQWHVIGNPDVHRWFVFGLNEVPP